MAKEAKKDPQELTVEQKLKALFQLQTMRNSRSEYPYRQNQGRSCRVEILHCRKES